MSHMTYQTARGMTLVEVLACVAILGVFVTMASTWLSAMTRVARSIESRERGLSAIEQTLATLARDLDSAAGRSIVVDDPNSLAFRTASPVENPRLVWHGVAWRFHQESGVLTRRASGSDRVALSGVQQFHVVAAGGQASQRPVRHPSEVRRVSIVAQLRLRSDIGRTLEISLPW